MKQFNDHLLCAVILLTITFLSCSDKGGNSRINVDNSNKPKPETNMRDKRNDIPDFSYLLLNSKGPGGSLGFTRIENYDKIINNEIVPFNDSLAQRYVEDYDSNIAYYPLLHIEYPLYSQHLYFLIGKNKGINQEDDYSFVMTVFKGESKQDEIDIWTLGKFKSIEDLATLVNLQKSLPKGDLYSFPFYSNIYTDGYYNITVTSEGKIEVEKIEVAEGDIP